MSHTTVSILNLDLSLLAPFLILFGMVKLGNLLSGSQDLASSILLGLACTCCLVIILHLVMGTLLGGIVGHTIFGLRGFLCLLGLWFLISLSTHNEMISPKSLLVGAVLISPILFLILLQNHYEWDDYSQWLPNAKHLYLTGDFIAADNPNVNSAMRTYPPLLSIISSLGQTGSTEFNPTVNILWNNVFVVLLAASIASLATVNTTHTHSGSSLIVFAAGVFLFIKIAGNLHLTAYADIPISVFTAMLFGGLAILMSSNTRLDRRNAYILVGSACLTIPLTKNYGIHLMVASLAAAFIAAAPMIMERQWKKTFSALLISLLLGFMATASWKLTLAAGDVQAMSRIANLHQWKWNVASDIGMNMLTGLTVQWNAIYFFAFLLPLVRPLGFIRGTTFTDTFLRCATMFALTNFALIYLFYLGVLSTDEAANMKSLHRYMLPSMTVTLCAVLICFSDIVIHKLSKWEKPLGKLAFTLSFIAIATYAARISNRGDIYVDPEDYTVLVDQALSETNSNSVGFVQGSSHLHLPRLIFLLPPHVMGTWFLNHDLEYLANNVKTSHQFETWLTNRNPDVLCFVGGLTKLENLPAKLVLLSENADKPCHSVDKIRTSVLFQ